MVSARPPERCPMRLDSRDPGFAAAFEALVSARRGPASDIAGGVAAILADVRSRGDTALLELTRQFARMDMEQTGWDLPKSARTAPLDVLDPELRPATASATPRRS